MNWTELRDIQFYEKCQQSDLANGFEFNTIGQSGIQGLSLSSFLCSNLQYGEYQTSSIERHFDCYLLKVFLSILLHFNGLQEIPR